MTNSTTHGQPWPVFLDSPLAPTAPFLHAIWLRNRFRPALLSAKSERPLPPTTRRMTASATSRLESPAAPTAPFLHAFWLRKARSGQHGEGQRNAGGRYDDGTQRNCRRNHTTMGTTDAFTNYVYSPQLFVLDFLVEHCRASTSPPMTPRGPHGPLHGHAAYEYLAYRLISLMRGLGGLLQVLSSAREVSAREVDLKPFLHLLHIRIVWDLPSIAFVKIQYGSYPAFPGNRAPRMSTVLCSLAARRTPGAGSLNGHAEHGATSGVSPHEQHDFRGSSSLFRCRTTSRAVLSAVPAGMALFLCARFHRRLSCTCVCPLSLSKAT